MSLIPGPDNEWFKQRLTAMMLVVLVAFSILLFRLFQLQILDGEEYRRLSENNCIRRISIPPQRGLIFDRNGKRLVDNRPAFDLSIVPRDARPLPETLAKLSVFLKTTEEELLKIVGKHRGALSYKPVLLRRDIGRDVLAVIEAHRFELPGIQVNVTPQRHYISSGVGAHLLGYLGEINARELREMGGRGYRGGDDIGRFGVEKEFENLLKGLRGDQLVEVNATGRVIRVIKTEPAVPGHNLTLTIDMGLQKKAEELLGDFAGSVVAIDPDNGEVLVLASSPSFNQNDFIGGISHEKWRALIENPQRPMENKAIQAEYPPASTYKIISAMASLEEGVADIDTVHVCTGRLKFGNRYFRCWKRWGHGKTDIVKALAESCDVFFYQTGQKLGVDRLAWYARACGLGSPTGIQLPHESSGLIPTAAWKKRRFGQPWHSGETLSVVIGQGYNLVTPLQLANMTAAIANNGRLYRPHILKSVRTPDGRMVYEGKSELLGELPVSAANLRIIQKGLWEVVNTRHGTAWGARIKGVDVYGKTGTAQVFSRKNDDADSGDEDPDHLKPHAWFVAYAYSQGKGIAVSVIVEHGEHGSSAAAPVARDVIAAYFAGQGSIPGRTGGGV